MNSKSKTLVSFFFINLIGKNHLKKEIVTEFVDRKHTIDIHHTYIHTSEIASTRGSGRAKLFVPAAAGFTRCIAVVQCTDTCHPQFLQQMG